MKTSFGPKLKRTIQMYSGTCKICLKSFTKFKAAGFCSKVCYRKHRYISNREHILAKTKEWAKNNPEKRKAIKDKWRAENKEKTNFLTRRYIYRRKHAEGNVTFEEVQEMYRQTPKCPYCWTNKSDTIDHVIPLSRGGTNNPDNLIAICRSCNSKKRDKTLREFKPLLAMMWDRVGRG